MSIAIYVGHHTPQPNLGEHCTYIKPVQLGCAMGRKASRGFLRDDIHDETAAVSARNNFWADAGFHHFVWKHAIEDYVGACHYRRYLSPWNHQDLRNLLGPNYDDFIGSRTSTNVENRDTLFAPGAAVRYLLSADNGGKNFVEMLQSVDMVLPWPFIMEANWTIEQNYLTRHDPDDWFVLERVLEDLYPNEAKGARGYFQRERLLFPDNIYLGRVAVVRQWHDWLFPILFECEKRIRERENMYPHYRPLGFIAEHLFSWWVYSRDPKRYHVPVLVPRELYTGGVHLVSEKRRVA